MRNGASDTLYHGSHLSPAEVFALVAREVAEEIDPHLGVDEGDALKRHRKKILAAVEECRNLYGEHGERAFALMRASDNTWSQRIGEALSSGDSARLAF